MNGVNNEVFVIIYRIGEIIVIEVIKISIAIIYCTVLYQRIHQSHISIVNPNLLFSSAGILFCLLTNDDPINE